MARIHRRKVRIIWMDTPAELADLLDKHWDRTEKFLTDEFNRAGIDVQSYAKRNHPWTNRTFQAENEFFVKTYWEGTTLRMDIAQGAPHGVFLEYRWGGKWGIIPLSMNYGGARIRAAMNAVMRGAR